MRIDVPSSEAATSERATRSGPAALQRPPPDSRVFRARPGAMRPAAVRRASMRRRVRLRARDRSSSIDLGRHRVALSATPPRKLKRPHRRLPSMPPTRRSIVPVPCHRVPRGRRSRSHAARRSRCSRRPARVRRLQSGVPMAASHLLRGRQRRTASRRRGAHRSQVLQSSPSDTNRASQAPARTRASSLVRSVLGQHRRRRRRLSSVSSHVSPPVFSMAHGDRMRACVSRRRRCGLAHAMSA